MKITYSIPLQIVTLEWTPAEQAELTEEARMKLHETFAALIAKVKDQLKELVKG